MTGPGIDEQIRVLLRDLATLGGEVQPADAAAPIAAKPAARDPRPVPTAEAPDPVEAMLALQVRQITYAAAQRAHARAMPRQLLVFLGRP